MRPSIFTAALAATFTASVSAINILVNNDDGFGAANIRELYRTLVADGHNVVMVAPATQRSGMGGRSYGVVPANLSAVGQDPIDPNIWYYNGTPAARTFVALDHVILQFYNNRTIDLLVSGPNFGTNLGPFVWTLSGTAGVAYSAVSHNIPAIAFSAGNLSQRSYFEINQTTPSGHADPATIAGGLGANIVSTLVNNAHPGDRLMPLGHSLNVNWAEIDTLKSNPSCISLTFYQTRFTGGAVTDITVRNATTGVFRYGDLSTDGGNTCIHGNCSLPGETEVVNSGCYGSISVFTIDYSAPDGEDDAAMREKLAGVALSGVPDAVVGRKGLSRSAYVATVKRRHN